IDHAALALLESRGLTRPERVRLAGLVTVAMSGNSGEAAMPEDSDEEQQRINDLIALRSWYVEWAEMARAVLKRRDQLGRLGPARRKKASKEAESQAPPVTPSPPPQSSPTSP